MYCNELEYLILKQYDFRNDQFVLIRNLALKVLGGNFLQESQHRVFSRNHVSPPVRLLLY
ncbi:hypothetical protein BDQ17DRAFT_1359222 [Cyathus striatus]|nr:hypothetical protein BDQ17DRAFT_1359222 [Cyathus striatus]